MLWATTAFQTIVFISPLRGLIQKQQVLICFGNHCSPNHSFYKPAAGSYPKTTSFNMLWATTALQTTVFISQLRGLIQKQQV
jgi:hypothetical protein